MSYIEICFLFFCCVWNIEINEGKKSTEILSFYEKLTLQIIFPEDKKERKKNKSEIISI